MTNEQIVDWEIRRAECCRAWGIPPWEFDRAHDAGQMTMTQIHRTLELAMIESNDPIALMEWRKPRTMEAIKEAEEERKIAESHEAFFKAEAAGGVNTKHER